MTFGGTMAAVGNALGTAGTWLVGEDDAKVIAAAANRDLSYLGSTKKRNFDEDVYNIIVDAVIDGFPNAGVILSSVILSEPLKYQPAESYTLTKKHISELNSELSSVGELIANDYVLLNKYANEELAMQKVMNFLIDIPIQMCSELSVIITILDILAGRYQEEDVGEMFLQALKSMADAILGIVKSAVKIGFPEIPILGNLGDLIEEILMVSQVIDGLPEEAKNQIQDAQSTINFSDKLADVLDKTVAKLINRGAEDIDMIVQNIRWLPITLLTGLVTGLIKAVTKIFSTLSLGTFNIDDFIPDMQLIPSFEFDLSIFEKFSPPGNVLEALLAALEMVPQFVANFKNIFKNSIFGLIWKIFNGLPILDNCFWDPDKILSATQVHLLSCQDVYGAIRTGRDLLQDCVNLQDVKDQIAIAQEEARQKKNSSKNPDENKHRAVIGEYKINAASAYYKAASAHLVHQMKAGYNYISSHDPGQGSAYYFSNGTKIAAQIVEDRNKEIEGAKSFSETKNAWANLTGKTPEGTESQINSVLNSASDGSSGSSGSIA